MHNFCINHVFLCVPWTDWCGGGGRGGYLWYETILGYKGCSYRNLCEIILLVKVLMCNVLTVLRWVSKYKVFSRILQSLWVKLSPFSTDTFPLKQKADRIKHNLFTPIHIFFSLPQPPLLSRELLSFLLWHTPKKYIYDGVTHNYHKFVDVVFS